MVEVPLDGLRVLVRTGTQPGDLIFTTPNVVSERFLGILRECNATGFDVFPVPLIKDGEQVALYYGLRVYGRGGEFDRVRSDADIGETGAIHGSAAVYMNEADWDGSDVFFIPGLGVELYVTERVALALKKAKLVNVQITLNSECRTGTRIDYSSLREGAKREK